MEKASSSSGVPHERIVNSSAQTLQRLSCSICLNILWKPVCCSSCQANFCSTCIDEWLVESKKKKNNLICTNRCFWVKKQSPPILKDLLSDLKILCTNTTLGCDAIVDYDALEAHEKDCAYTTKKCDGCKSSVVEGGVQEHRAGCELVRTACEYCDRKFLKDEFASHNKSECLQKTFMELKYENKKLKQEHKQQIDYTNSILDSLLDENANLNKRLEESKTRPSEQQQLSLGAQKDLLSLPTCNKGHDLKFTSKWSRAYHSTRFKCNKCRKTKDLPSWHCVPCSFDLCSACRPFEGSKRKCPNNHGLTNSVYRYNPSCDICSNQIPNHYPQCCATCNFDVCENCEHLFA